MADFKSSKINNRRYPGIKGIRPDMKAIKRDEAKSRLEVWQGLTPQAQLAVLDGRLGVGNGAVKQRARLAALIAKQQETKAIESELAKRKEKNQ